MSDRDATSPGATGPGATSPGATGLDAVILAGGRAGRLGGASKPDLVVGGRRLLQTAIDAARAAGCERIVVVGPPTLEAAGCLVVREDPPFGGPVAGLAAGLAALAEGEPDAAAATPPLLHVPQQWRSPRRAEAASGPGASRDVLVLACDMPEAVAAVAHLVEARRTALTTAAGAGPGAAGGAGAGAAAGAGVEAGAAADGICLVDDTGRLQWLAAVYSRAALARAFDALPGGVDGAPMKRLAASLDLTVVADDGTTHDIDTWSDLARARATGQEDTMTEPRQSSDVLDQWVVEAAEVAGIDPADVPIEVVLDLTRRVAHGVARPAGPLTAYVLGVAVGSGLSAENAAALADRLGSLAESRGTDGDLPTP